ncbi:MAG TPA: hypothetical protein VGQ64_00945 [Candidatus Limnocylindrales bacterium]|nr:hypothetical protein [Candidatus Limnocylindrales bacterium]
MPRCLLLTACLVLLGGCSVGPAPATPPISPGTAAAPREVNIIAKDWQFLPDRVDLVPGETVLIHILNGGLDVHEVVIGDALVQDAWERAEAATADHPPGPTPVVSVAPELAGLRVVVASGQRIDVTWTVPSDVDLATGRPVGAAELVVGCHIPGHWAKGMVVPIQLVHPSAAP